MSLKTASVLAFERKLNPSDALLYAGNWDERASADSWPGIRIAEKAVRGTISNRLKHAIASDPVKLDAEVQKPNLQTVDAAALPPDKDTLMVRFTLRALGGLGTPSACNSQDYQQALQSTVEQYLGEHGLAELAARYAANLANARFLWRNRLGAESIEVHLQCGDNEALVVDAYARPLDDLSLPDGLEPVADWIEEGLRDGGHRLITVTAFARLGAGQEVYPSQELVQKKEKTKSKYLYRVGEVAGIHSQKIGNAIRTIDDWHPEVDAVGVIAVEPYGSVTSRGAAYRNPKAKTDFYSLLDNWVLKGKAPDDDQQHFVIANLIRGGVFGEAGN